MNSAVTLTDVPVPPRRAPAVWRVITLSFYLGWQDVRMMYRRTVLGQFWITISMIVTFAAIGTVFGFVFNSPVIEYLPYLGCGLVFFNFLSLILNDGANAFIAAESFIRQVALEPIVYFLRSVWKTFFVLLHNALALILLFVFFPQGISPATLLVVPGLVVAASGISGLALALAMLATRYRDVPQIVAAVVQVLFYLTPIVWLPEALPAPARDALLTWNPLTHMIAVMREPLLGSYPSPQTWLTAVGLAVAFVALGAGAYALKRRELAFWV
ncbi:MAG: ABC transporter permease [Microbacteriaceae bacterium]|nr:ABC transporter permease [Microbacteriaceae bacterium]